MGLVLLVALVGGGSIAPVRGSDDYKLAPPPEELDARTEGWVQGRRWMALVIVGGTLVAGAAASVLRRRR